MIKEQEEKIMDNETLIDEVSEIAYDKTVEVVTEKVRAHTGRGYQASGLALQ